MRVMRIFIFFLLCFHITNAQPKPAFWDEIQQFRKEDSLNFPGKNKILFTGSSTIRMWKDIQQAFPGYPIINRGFGGSRLPDMIRYVSDIIYPYDPKQLFIYCGDNDLASSDTVTVNIVVERFKNLFKLVRDKFPKLQVLFISIKPSPSRRRLLPKIEEANFKIKRFLKKRSRTKFVDVFHPMMNPDGSIITDIWLADSLHMNSKGYEIWQKVLEPYLRK